MKLTIALILSGIAAAQEAAHQHPATAPVPLQPLAQQVRQLEDALNYPGQACLPPTNGASTRPSATPMKPRRSPSSRPRLCGLGAESHKSQNSGQSLVQLNIWVLIPK
jgi:hypothetical protein